jgi:hypothetical protein
VCVPAFEPQQAPQRLIHDTLRTACEQGWVTTGSSNKAEENTMKFTLLASGVAALGMLAFASTFQPAQARPGGGHFHGGHFHGGHFHGGGQRFGFHHHRFHRFHRHNRFVIVGAYPYYYDDGCYWLRRRALYTGSPYWWRRYNACTYGY